MARKQNRPTWVFTVGTYRTASTCQYQIVEDVVQMTESGIGVGYHTSGKLDDWDEYRPGRYVVCKVFKYLPEISTRANEFLKEGRLRAIGSIRDPRDIITSMKKRANERWPGEKDKVLGEELPIWLGDFMKWVSLGPQITRVSRFEDFTVNLPWEVREIARFLEIDLPEGMDSEIAAKNTKEAQLARAAKLRELGIKEEHPMLPHLPGIVFGTSGQWAELLEPDEVRKVEQVAGSLMRRWEYL